MVLREFINILLVEKYIFIILNSIRIILVFILVIKVKT